MTFLSYKLSGEAAVTAKNVPLSTHSLTQRSPFMQLFTTPHPSRYGEIQHEEEQPKTDRLNESVDDEWTIVSPTPQTNPQTNEIQSSLSKLNEYERVIQFEEEIKKKQGCWNPPAKYQSYRPNSV